MTATDSPAQRGEAAQTRLNSLSDLVTGVTGSNPYDTQTIAQPFTLAQGNAYAPLSLNRVLLSYSFMTQGLVQTVVKQPVEDAFRGGFDIKSNELSDQEIAQLQNAIKRPRRRDRTGKQNKFTRKVSPNACVTLGNSDIRVAMDVLNWSRLYGGAGLVINTNQNFSQPLDIEAIKPDSPLEFLAADRWELILTQMNIFDTGNPTPFNYYGLPLHSSRVVKVLGIEAPSYIRQRLQGWGMSEIERCIRAINSFIKFENLVFELLDEAKIDVFQIMGFNDALLTDEGTANTQRRVDLANRMKNFQNALVMDKEDAYQQKQLSWSGLAEMWNEIRLNLSSDLKIPMNKLFGQSATGFGGGQDAIENYNSVVEQVRVNAEPVMVEIIDLRCQQLFGYLPEYTLAWKPLKALDGVQEEEVKTKKQDRVMELFQQRLVTGIEASTILRRENLLDIDTEVSDGLRDVEPTLPNAGDPSEKAIEADAAKQKQKPKTEK
jgi:phage-related protein (TIGR01555 family)